MTAVQSSTAAAFARIEARERVRTLRMQRHLAFAVAGALSLGIVGPAADTVLEWALFPLLVGVIVRSVARGADAKFGHIWGWIYEEPRVATALDRSVNRIIEWARPRRQAEVGPTDVRVRPLDPFADIS